MGVGMVDPLSVLIGVPFLGPVVAWTLWDLRMARKEHAEQIAGTIRIHHEQLAEQRQAWVSQVDRLQVAYQELASRVQDNFSRVVSDNTAATRGLEKAVDTLVRQTENNRQAP